jgi:hypothetical protein
VLDGEVAIYDERLRSRFDWLREPDADAVATPPMFMVFDLLHQDGREPTGRPLRDRRARLENVVAGSDLVLPGRRLAKNGFEAWAEVIAHDYEGMVAKEEASLYEGGTDAAVVEGQAEGLDGRRGPLAAAHQHGEVNIYSRRHWRGAPARSSVAGVTLFADLDAIYLAPERCGDLDSGLDGDRVWMACTCGAVINRRTDDD